MENLQREVVLDLGKTGSGKTTWAANYVRSKPRVLIVDADFHEFNALDFGSFDDVAAYLRGHVNPSDFFRVAYTPYADEYPYIFDLARLCAPVTLVLEEADRFELCPEYEEVIARGRHHGINILALSRYPFSLPPMLRREATRIIAFHHHEPADLSWFKDVMGSETEQLTMLREHEYLDWRPGQTEKLLPQKLSLTAKQSFTRIPSA